MRVFLPFFSACGHRLTMNRLPATENPKGKAIKSTWCEVQGLFSIGKDEEGLVDGDCTLVFFAFLALCIAPSLQQVFNINKYQMKEYHDEWKGGTVS